MSNSTAEHESEEDWIYVDADGNLISGETEDWVYLDSDNSVVVTEPLHKSSSDEPKTSLPKLRKASSTLKKASKTKVSLERAPRKPSRPVHHAAPRSAVYTSRRSSIWPLVWCFILLVAAFFGWKYYPENRTLIGRNVKVPSQASVEDSNQEMIKDPIPVSLVDEENLEPTKPVIDKLPTEKPAEKPKVIPAKVEKTFQSSTEIPPQGLIAHYHAANLDEKFSWNNLAEGYTNQFTITQDSSSAPFAIAFTGTDPNGKPFETKILELNRNTALSSREAPFSTDRRNWGISIALLARSAGDGPLLTIKMAEPEKSELRVCVVGDELNVNLHHKETPSTIKSAHPDREWRVIVVSWNAENGALDLAASSLAGVQEERVSSIGAGFEFRLDHLKIGPDLSAQISDLLIYDRPLDQIDINQLQKALPLRFYGSKE